MKPSGKTTSVALALLALLVFTATAGAQSVETVPFPDTEDMEPGVKQLVQDRVTKLNEAIAQGGDRSIGLAYGELAMAYNAHGMREAAMTCYRNAKALVPDDSRWPYFLGNMLVEDGEFEKAADNFRLSLELNAEYPQTEIHLARALLNAGRLDEARRYYESSLEKFPDNAVAFDGLGRIALQQNNHEQAAMHFERALEIQPLASQVNFLLSQAYRELGMEEQAQTALARRGDRETSFVDPLMGGMQAQNRSFGYWTSAGNQAAKQGNYVAAAERFTIALNLRPDEPIAHVNMARAMEALHKDDAAMVAVDTALGLDPQYAEAHFNKGAMLERRGDDAGAQRHYESALRSDAKHYQARTRLAAALMRAGSYQRAADQYATLTEQYPEDLQSRFRRALAQMAGNRCQEAMEGLEQLVVQRPDDPNYTEALVRNIATCPAASEVQRDNALQAARKLYQFDPSLSSSEALAMIEAASGNFEAAVDYQTQAIFLALRDGNTALQDQLKENMDLYQANEKPQRALAPSHVAISPPRLRWVDRYGNARDVPAPREDGAG